MKIAFVIPWYGENIPGGAETHCRTLAEHLTTSGLAIEVLTTCALDFYHWDNHHREGEYKVNNVPVRRFTVNPRDEGLFHRINAKLIHNISLSPAEEQDFMKNMVNSDNLYKFIESHRDEYLFVFTPYMFGTTYFGVDVAPDRSFLMPCLHDESYAHMRVFQDMFRKAHGFIFLSHSEMDLAKTLYGLEDDRCFLLGAGVDTDVKSDGSRFRRRRHLEEPFVLYVGRKDPGKNTPLLLAYFKKYRERRPDSAVKLVLIGSGDIAKPEAASGVIDLGFVDAQDKYDAYAAASVLCQPSVNESFSLVLMESWICGTPVLVNEACPPAREHVLAGNGGLFFKDYLDFESCLDVFLNDREARDAMARQGREYVIENYRWGVVTDRYAKVFAQAGLS